MSDRPVPHPIAFRAVMIGLGFVQTVNIPAAEGENGSGRLYLRNAEGVAKKPRAAGSRHVAGPRAG